MLRPPLDVNALVTGMRGRLAGLIPEGIEVVLDLAPECSRASADPAQLEQLVASLVVHASGALPDGGRVTIETADVELETSPFYDEPVVQGHYVMLAITDSGPGTSTATQIRAVDAWEQPARNGCGLGATSDIVTDCKGYMWVYGEPIQGTTFKVYLPRAGGDDPAIAKPAMAAAPLLAHQTILLVEDESSVRQLAKRILAEAGYRVLEAVDGEDAERVFVQHGDTIDLIVTDVIMPGCDGHELVRRLGTRAAHVKVLYMSGYTKAAALAKTDLTPGEPFVQKPFTAAEFLRRVRSASVPGS